MVGLQRQLAEAQTEMETKAAAAADRQAEANEVLALARVSDCGQRIGRGVEDGGAG